MGWLSLLHVLGPRILTTMNVAGMLVPVVIDGIQHAQAMKGASGAEKKAHVLGIVSDAVGVLNTTGKGSGLDPAETAATVGKGIDATVEALKVIHALKAA